MTMALWLVSGVSPFFLSFSNDPVETYSKTSMPILKVEAQFTVVEAALKSYMKWRVSHNADEAEDVSF